MEVSERLATSVTHVPMPVPFARKGGPMVEGETAYPFDELAPNTHFTVFNRAAATVRQAIGRYYKHRGREKVFVQRMDAAGNPTVWRVK